MSNIQSYLESGIIEAYVLGLSSMEENSELEILAESHPEIQKEMDAFSLSLEMTAAAHAVLPDETIKPMLMAIIDFEARAIAGEKMVKPLELNANSKISDYESWLKRDDMNLPEDAGNLHARIIGLSRKSMLAILWVKDKTPPEVHTNELESFLIVEGTCDVSIDDDVHSLVAGDFITIPLYKTHSLRVTSSTPCKAILQRKAA